MDTQVSKGGPPCRITEVTRRRLLDALYGVLPFKYGSELVIRKIGGPRGSGYGCHGFAVGWLRRLGRPEPPRRLRPLIGIRDVIAV